MQQRLLKTANQIDSSGDRQQAQYISSQKPGQLNVKVNPLMQSADGSSSLVGLPPMATN